MNKKHVVINGERNIIRIFHDWDGAYHEARVSDFEQVRADRDRFTRRIDRIGKILNPILIEKQVRADRDRNPILTEKQVRADRDRNPILTEKQVRADRYRNPILTEKQVRADRDRFKRRITRIGEILNPILTEKHRDGIYNVILINKFL